MPSSHIDSAKFGELLLAEFPDVRERVVNYEGLDYVKLMEFALFTKELWERGEWDTAKKSLLIADKLLHHGGSDINNAVYRVVSRDPASQRRSS